MSYILEALKKAQAERQLGNAPTIHAPQPVQVNAAAGGPAARRTPLLLGLGAGALVVLGGAVLLWQRGPASDAQKVASSAQAAQAAQATVPSPASAPASATLAVRAPDMPAPAPRALPPASAPAPASASHPGAGLRADARVAAAQPQPAPPAGQRAQSAPPSAPGAAPEDSLPLVQQLSEQVRSQIPRVTFGGYMYSANAADRLLLVDNALRHEGEEVAPGLVLEKLLPRAAVLNFRGMRYRVGL
jgi:general secretion pathway protein B